MHEGLTGGNGEAEDMEAPRVVGRRRLATLRALADRGHQAHSDDEACRIAAAELACNPSDLPFALLYLLDGEGRRLRLAGHSGLAPGTPASPLEIALDAVPAHWPFQAALHEATDSGKPAVATGLEAAWEALPGGPWPEPGAQAVVLPMKKPGQRLTGFFIGGVNPRLLLDDSYRGFLDLAAAQVATAVANAGAYEAELRRAHSLAEFDRAKAVFFSNISDEFRTPLALMLGPLENILAAEGTLPPQVREDLHVTHRHALRLLKLVTTLLDFSRIDSGRLEARYEPLDPAPLTAELADSFRSAIERAGLRFTVDCASPAEPVWLDRGMWEKVVLNLLSNAFKYTFEGEIAVRLAPCGPDAVALLVSDTGAGIAAEDLPRLFERFHRLRGTRARSSEGAGIGLALVRELVTLHGGGITVASTPGRGTAFTVRIPTGSAHLPQDCLAPAGPAPAQAAPSVSVRPFIEAAGWRPSGPPVDEGPGPGGETILLADGNADMRDYVGRLLAPHYRVEVVVDGASALRAAQAGPPDLVLTDSGVPGLEEGLDGLALLRALRADPRTREVPVILLSARADEEAKIEGLDAGADDYLVRPFTARELLARVRGHLTLARERRSAARELRQRLAELQQANAATRDARRATLNVLEDAIEARDCAERLYREVREREAWLAGQSKALEAALNGAPLKTALGLLVAPAIAQLGEDVRVAFYLANDAGTTLHHVVGMPQAYAEAVDGLRIGPESLACGLATHSGRAVLTGDVMTDARWVPWRWLAERFGYRGCWSFPIHTSAGVFVGSVAVYWPAPREAGGRELDFAAHLTQVAAIIISHQRNEHRMQEEGGRGCAAHSPGSPKKQAPIDCSNRG